MLNENTTRNNYHIMYKLDVVEKTKRGRVDNNSIIMAHSSFLSLFQEEEVSHHKKI
jgi:hypothetical protein